MLDRRAGTSRTAVRGSRSRLLLNAQHAARRNLRSARARPAEREPRCDLTARHTAISVAGSQTSLWRSSNLHQMATRAACVESRVLTGCGTPGQVGVGAGAGATRCVRCCERRARICRSGCSRVRANRGAADHSTFSHAQCQRFAEASLFEQLFISVLRQCTDAGLVGGRLLLVDATHVEADAALKELARRARRRRRRR